MGRLGPLGAREKRGDTAVDLARSLEPGRATTESANHLRIPDLRKDQAEETVKASAAGSPAAVRASIVRNVVSDAWTAPNQTAASSASPAQLRPSGAIRAKLTRNVVWRESSPSDELAELDWM
jgi:hypothetical protein